MSFTSDTVQVFLAVLDHGSFSAAARALRRVPSAVSMTIAGLEAELDLVLFDRAGREPKPTAAARSLEPQARLLAAQLRQLQVQALSLTQGLEHRLTLAIAPELLAALSLITAGLGWGWLPRKFAQPHVAAGALVEIPFENLSNGLDLWVDVVWSRERPLGLGAQRFVALIARRKD